MTSLPPSLRLVLAFGLACLVALPAGEVAKEKVTASRSYVVDVWDTDDGLPQNSITSMVQTPDGYLWMGTLDGLVRFDGIRFSVFDQGNTPGLNSGRILKLLADRQGSLWIGTETAGILLVVREVGLVLGFVVPLEV